jgi:predicted PurR-regulated permease PerM
MDKTPVSLPHYAKASLLAVGLYYFVSILSILQGIVLPIIYAGILAILVSPAVKYLVKKRINRATAIAVVLVGALLFGVLVIALISSQASRFSEALPQLADRFDTLLNQVITWFSDVFNVRTRLINEWIATTKADLVNNSSGAIGNTVSTVGSVLATVILTPVYVFMLLYYQPHLVGFVHRIFGAENDSKVSEILTETKSIVQSYLVGLSLQFAIVAVLNSIGLLIIGLEYAILLGTLGALLNIIPYLGGLITMFIFAAIALVTKSPVHMVYVLAMYTLIQFIDNNYVSPKIVGSKVRLNALVSFIAVIAGAALWGIPGMFLSIPLTAVVKLILDRIESVKSWGYLLGDTMPPLRLKLGFRGLSKDAGAE